MLGIIAGTSLGILVRTNNVLGIVSVEKQDNSFTQLQAELTQLKEQEDTEEQKKGKWEGLDISLSDIAQRIIDKHYPKGGGAVNQAAASYGALSAAITPEDCEQLLAESPSGKRDYIKQHLHIPELASLAPLLKKSDEELEKAIRNNCPSSSE